MKYLLDMNVIIALGMIEHALHARVLAWLRAEPSPQLITCSITELGFVRVLAQTPAYDTSVARAQKLLREIKTIRGLSFVFVSDSNGADDLPGWVKTGKQTTDGHLMQLAAKHDAVLATLDRGIPGAFVIP